MKYHTYPSLKPEEDRVALWKGLLNGDIDTVATDLVATDYQNKTKYKTVCDCTG
jgi:dihydroorotase-like cyclic amidohydrolase